MRRKRERPGEEPFQMAPMIDMVFLLLVFFMTVSTLARESRPELELAVSATAAVPAEAPPRDIITVMAEDNGFRYYWHSKPVTADELGKLVAQAAREEGTQLLLRGGPELPWEAWESVLRLCRGAGVGDIVFATFEG